MPKRPSWSHVSSDWSTPALEPKPETGPEGLLQGVASALLMGIPLSPEPLFFITFAFESHSTKGSPLSSPPPTPIVLFLLLLTRQLLEALVISLISGTGPHWLKTALPPRISPLRNIDSLCLKTWHFSEDLK